MNRSILVFTTLCIFTLLVAYYFLNDQTPSPNIVNKVNPPVTPLQSSTINQSGSSPNNAFLSHNKPIDSVIEQPNKHDTLEPPAENTGDIISPVEKEAIIQWRESQGWYSTEKQAEYASYDNDTIFALANTGDILAMQRAAELLRQQNKNREAQQMLYQAATYGSTFALSELALQTQNRMHALQGDNSNEELQPANVLWLALKKVQLLRGDITAQMHIDSLTNIPQYQITDDVDLKAELQAQEIYAKLEDDRYRLGLEPFNNSTPKELYAALKNARVAPY